MEVPQQQLDVTQPEQLTAYLQHMEQQLSTAQQQLSTTQQQLSTTHAQLTDANNRLLSLESTSTSIPSSSSLPKPAKPDFFHGNKDATTIRQWTAQVDNYYLGLATDCPQPYKLAFAVSLLPSNALAYWQAVPDRPTTWEVLRDRLINHYAPSSAATAARDKLADLNQEGAVAVYTRKFMAYRLEVPDMQEAEAMDRYLRGLKPTVRMHVAFTNPATLEEMQNAAAFVDRIVYTSKGDYYPRRSYSGASTSAAAPMEIGAITATPPRSKTYADAVRPKKLTDAERAHLRATGGCFYCRQPGHRTDRCPLRKGKAPLRQ